MNTGNIGFAIYFALSNNYLSQTKEKSNLEIKEEQGLFEILSALVGITTDQ